MWVGNSTYLSLAGGHWCYLTAQMPTEPMLHALKQARTLRQSAPGLIVHADRGSQYTSAACRARLNTVGAVPSFSRPGNPYDNAQAASGWRTLKTELLPHGMAFAALGEARLEVAHYLDTYINPDHRHSAIGYRSPHQFELDLKTNLPELTVRFYQTTPYSHQYFDVLHQLIRTLISARPISAALQRVVDAETGWSPAEEYAAMRTRRLPLELLPLRARGGVVRQA